MLIFILEDDNNRMIVFRKALIGHRIDHATTVQAGIEMIKTNKYDFIFLDHDLGGEQMVDSASANTGYQLARFIATNDRNKDTPCIIHTCNPCGADNMRSTLPHAHKIPFPVMKISIDSSMLGVLTYKGENKC